MYKLLLLLNWLWRKGIQLGESGHWLWHLVCLVVALWLVHWLLLVLLIIWHGLGHLGLHVHITPVEGVWCKVHAVIVALILQEAAFVAYISEGIVEILTSITGPITWSGFTFEFIRGTGVIMLLIVLRFGIVLLLLLLLFSKLLGCFVGCSFFTAHIHVLWLSSGIVFISVFLASETLSSTLEIIVRA